MMEKKRGEVLDVVTGIHYITELFIPLLIKI